MPFLTTDKRFWDDRAVTLETTSSIPQGDSLSVTIYQDVYGDGFPDKQTTKSLTGGTESFALEPFVRAKRSDYWMKFEATGSPTLDRATLISGTSSTIDYTSNADWRRTTINSGFTQDDLGDHVDGAVFQRGYNYGSITEGLVAYYPFDDDWDSNPVRDKALDNDGTNNGATYVDGQIRSAGDFNGTSDYVNLTDLGVTENPPFSISAWVKTTDSGTFKTAFAEASTSNDTAIIDFGKDDTNVARVFYRNSAGTSTEVLSSTAINDGSWHNIVVVATSSTIYLYQDGNFSDSDTNNPGTISTNTSNIGVISRQSGFTGYWNGQIDEVRIYDRALSQPEIERLANLTEPSTVTPNDTL